MQSSRNDIVNKVIAETATREEAREVAGWFSSSIEGQQHLSDMLDRDAYIMEAEPHTGNSFSPMQSDLLYERIDKKIRKNRFRMRSLKIAAVLFPLVIITGFALFIGSETDLLNKPTYSELYVPKGEDARIYFQDGTEVFLNADTRIRYPDKFGLRNREVYLDGEAYFNVKANRRKPFVVHAQNTKTEVLGTSFNVNAYSNNNTIQVVLDDGQTAFHVHARSYPMLPGQQVEYDKTTGKTTLRNLRQSSHASLWKKNTIYFYDTPLGDVIKVLERRFNVRFHVHSPEALNYSYTLTTRQSSIESVLDELQKITPVKFNVEEAVITVHL
jgi:transmembrane sensor